MTGYSAFAAFYDRLTTDVAYADRAEYLLSLFERHGGGKPPLLLDLACGSGSLSIELAARGVDVIGVDASQDMLSMAMEKTAQAGYSLLFLEQDMRALDLYGTVNGAVCTLDSLNHVTTTAGLAEVFRRLRLFIEPDGLFLFDVNTPYKHREILGDNAFVYEQENFLCVWRNRLIPRTCEVEMLLDFFVEEADGTYSRLSDMVRERAYTRATWEKLLRGAGFEMVGFYEDMTEHEPSPTCERWQIVAVNPP